jgi:hypothetical protein
VVPLLRSNGSLGSMQSFAAELSNVLPVPFHISNMFRHLLARGWMSLCGSVHRTRSST